MSLENLARSVCTLVLSGVVLAAPGRVSAQFIDGPVLGFVPDRAGAIVRPIQGIPGAAGLGEPIQIGATIRDAVISPRHDYAIARRAEDGHVVVMDLRSPEPVLRSVAGLNTPASRIAVSPAGETAAVYDPVSASVRVVEGLPDQPRSGIVLDASGIPGPVNGLAISDDGNVAIVRFDDGEVASWTLEVSGIPRRIPVGAAGAAAFLPDSHDAVIVEDATRTAYIVEDVAGRATRVPLLTAPDGAGGFSSVAADRDGRRVVLAGADSGALAIVDIATRLPVWIDCACRPRSLDPLLGPSIFRLDSVSDDPIRVLDASVEPPVIRIVPPPEISPSESQ